MTPQLCLKLSGSSSLLVWIEITVPNSFPGGPKRRDPDQETDCLSRSSLEPNGPRDSTTRSRD